MRKWLGSGLVVGLLALAVWLMAEGLDYEPASTPSPAPSTTESSPTVTTTATTTTTEGDRPAEALAKGVESKVREFEPLDSLHLDPVDVAVLAALAAVALWFLLRRRAGSGPVRVEVVDASSGTAGGSGRGTDPKADGSAGDAAPPTEGIAALVRDRLGRVSLTPPTGVPSAEEEGAAEAISVLEAVDPTKSVGAVARALTRLSPGHRRGHVARLVMRRSDTTPEAGVTVELSDLDAGVTLSVTSVWGDTFQDAARKAAFQIAAMLLGRLRRHERRQLWWRWEPSGRSLQAYEDAGWEIRHRRYDAAVAHLEEGLEHDPGNLAIRLRLGQTYERVRRYEDALLTYQSVFDPTHRIDPRYARCKEAGLIRWRVAVVLSNGQRWGPAWARTVVADDKAQHTADRRARALLDNRYRPKLGHEFPTIFGTLLAPRAQREYPLAGAADSSLPRIRYNDPLNRVRLWGDRGPGSTVTAIERHLPNHTPNPQAHRDERVLAVADATRCAVAIDSAATALRRARAAVSIEHLLWRAAQVEAAELRGRLRRNAGLTVSDMRTLRASINQKRLEDAGLLYAIERQRGAARFWAGLARAASWLRIGGFRRARAQAEYNAACCLALALPVDARGRPVPRPEQVREVIDLLGRACTGVDNMIEQGAATWMVYEDPDLKRVRADPQFCKFAKSTLHLEIEPAVTSFADVLDRHTFDLVRDATATCAETWRRHLAAPPTGRDLVAVLRTDQAAHKAVWALLSGAPVASTGERAKHRRDLAEAVGAFAPAHRDPPGWPEQVARIGRHGGNHWSRGIADRHEEAARHSGELANRLAAHLDGRIRRLPLWPPLELRSLLTPWDHTVQALGSVAAG
jgi:hypothetical protein